ncbi:MAG: CCA tRNA nucleotidyltransferase [Hyphomonas sp.]|nr:CCA tRNA nucleotidyltransferase [Hyphomonas sp.]MAU66137.1 CCA tRNA nucleotidyltransferase [Hyphomonas sp.]MBM59577.1 CCA tRNA nucleotidyltransferase [Hyphomonas sp.]MBM59856.1 CCA tRNA nucleotidyltransferase [Hyphomonas sp.]
MAALEAARPDGSRFVGGCVRNTLRGIPADDIDIATQILPEDVMTAMKAAGIRALPTGIEHGTVTAIIDSEPFEITSLRRDVETDGRRAVVAFTEDWAEDAQRRDFRLNAIYAGPDGTLHEVVPGSIEDALSGRVIFIGDGDQRLKEDYLRILRFFRFNAWYGADVDAEGLAACTRQKDGLAKIARERIWKELKRLLEAPDPSDAMLAMEESGVLAAILPEASAGALPALVSAEQGEGLAPDPMQRLMALLPRRLREVREAGRILRLSNAERDRLAAWADPALAHVGTLSPADLAEAFYRHGTEAVCDRALIEAASGAGESLKLVLASAARWTRPAFPVGGEDALAAGLSGPAVGNALAQAEEAWIASGFTLPREALLARLSQPD